MAIEIRLKVLKDPLSWLSHFLGFLAAIVGLVFLVLLTAGDGPKVAGMAIYGGTLVTMFFTSSTYHFFDIGVPGNRWLRRLDHTAIFLLIAGSYVPPMIHLLDGTWRIAMLVAIASLTVLGIGFKLLWIECPRWLSVGVYLALGWAIFIPGPIILPKLDATSLAWLGGGGLAYSLGALIYARRWPDPWTGVFGFHEIWHVFVLTGAACHYFFALGFIDAPYPPF